MSFASSLHSPTLRKSVNKESIQSGTRNRSPGEDNGAVSASPPEEEEEAGWSKVRSATRGSAGRGFERRNIRSERGERKGRETFDGAPTKITAFRNNREGESHNWRTEKTDLNTTDQMRMGRQDERPEFLDNDDSELHGGDGKEHSAEEFQAWMAKMRGKQEEPSEITNNPGFESGKSPGCLISLNITVDKQSLKRPRSRRSWMSTAFSLWTRPRRLGIRTHLRSFLIAHQQREERLGFDSYLSKINNRLHPSSITARI
jgi:hypothetical protein